MDTNSAIFTLFSMTASALLLNSNCGIRGARQAQLAGDGGQGHEDGGAATGTHSYILISPTQDQRILRITES